MKILLVCDRSGGHIFPALTLAKKIRECSNDKVYFFSTSKFLSQILTKEGFKVYGKGFLYRNTILEMFYRFFEAIYLLCRLNPNKIIGFGGRDSIFLIIFGYMLGKYTAIYEPNVKFGKANRLLCFFSRKVYYGLLETPPKNSIFVGIPLRANIKLIEKQKAKSYLSFDIQKPVLFCFGGSQGSVFLNSIFLRLLGELDVDFCAIHITGKKEYFKIRSLYNKINKKVVVFDFYADMHLLYSAADLVISRAGALSLAEISYFRLPAILIPHPSAARHQEANADYFVKRGAAFSFRQDEFDFEKFKNLVKKLLKDENLLLSIRENMGKLKFTVSADNFYKAIYYQ